MRRLSHESPTVSSILLPSEGRSARKVDAQALMRIAMDLESNAVYRANGDIDLVKTAVLLRAEGGEM